jgi:hypothetical protein
MLRVVMSHGNCTASVDAAQRCIALVTHIRLGMIDRCMIELVISGNLALSLGSHLIGPNWRITAGRVWVDASSDITYVILSFLSVSH